MLELRRINVRASWAALAPRFPEAYLVKKNEKKKNALFLFVRGKAALLFRFPPPLSLELPSRRFVRDAPLDFFFLGRLQEVCNCVAIPLLFYFGAHRGFVPFLSLCCLRPPALCLYAAALSRSLFSLWCRRPVCRGVKTLSTCLCGLY